MEEDQYHKRARQVLNKWVSEINQVGMMSLDRDYMRGLILKNLEDKMVAECLVDLLAKEFRADAEGKALKAD